MWTLWKLSKLLGVDRASDLGAGLARLGAVSLPFLRKANRNLERAFPEAPPAAIAAIVARACDNFGRVTAEFPHLEALGAGPRVEVVGEEHIAPFRAAGQPCIFVSGHLGNWEVSGRVMVSLGMPLTAVYAPLRNPILDRMLRRQRQRIGCGLVPKGSSGTRLLVSSLCRGQSLGLLVDRKRKDGSPVRFFGRPAMTTTAPARLALKYGCPVIPAHVERLEGARFRFVIDPPLEVPHGDPETCVLLLTEKINDTIEGWVRANPGQWCCFPRRWGGTPVAAGQSEAGRAAA